jgi:hypothetical protein
MYQPLLAIVATAIGSLQWTQPSGWDSLPPPSNTDIAYVYLPQSRDGQNIAVSIDPLPRGSSLRDETAKLVNTEANDGRTIVSVKSHATCDGKQPGMDVYAKFGTVASQYYHVTIDNGRMYVFIYTYAPGSTISSNVANAFESLCAAPPAA